MNINFVVWNTNGEEEEEESWSVLLDSCTHRFAPLSLGRINSESGCIECPYHGWNFDSEGVLTHVPQLDGDNIETLQSRGNIQSFPTHITGDLLWTFLPTSIHNESYPIGLLPEHYYKGIQSDLDLIKNHNRKIIYSSHEMPSSMDITVEK